MHFCQEELLALTALLATIPFLGPWLRAKLYARRKPHCCKPEHKAMPNLDKVRFIDWLRSQKACEPALEWAETQETARDIVEKCPDVNWLIWLLVRIKDPALAEYERIRGPAWAEYERIKDQAEAEYERIRDPALAEYERIRDPALAEYQRIKGPAWAEYERIVDPALAEYERTRDQALAEYQRIKGTAARQALTWERVCEFFSKS